MIRKAYPESLSEGNTDKKTDIYCLTSENTPPIVSGGNEKEAIV